MPPDGAQRFVCTLEAAYPVCSKILDICLHNGVAHDLTPDMLQNMLNRVLRA